MAGAIPAAAAIADHEGPVRNRLTLDPASPGGPALVQIGTDGGLLERPIGHDATEVAPAQRFDIIVDFGRYAAGQEVTVVNEFGEGSTAQVMRFRVTGPAPDGSRIPISDSEGNASVVAGPENHELRIYWKGDVPASVRELARTLDVPVAFLPARFTHTELVTQAQRLAAAGRVIEALPAADGSGLAVSDCLAATSESAAGSLPPGGEVRAGPGQPGRNAPSLISILEFESGPPVGSDPRSQRRFNDAGGRAPPARRPMEIRCSIEENALRSSRPRRRLWSPREW